MSFYESEMKALQMKPVVEAFIASTYPGYVEMPLKLKLRVRATTKAVKRKAGGNSGGVGRRARAAKRCLVPKIRRAAIRAKE